ncbi:Eukaryotic peptide chain release factor GTP-binding subunit ERF3B [Thelohanellus kitauei]|uniref:Eukaryotic peptide chain release factor GTP-binding subunit ERF3B n=1 Tax=Thelohanellus kitauei TaxID=669202 RepID=A0A0C2IWG8_THEKT|nr:Eukaryotic peptide chain release factor GTP-binding subunit ERF3B [Thelohanellus kitauei]
MDPYLEDFGDLNEKIDSIQVAEQQPPKKVFNFNLSAAPFVPGNSCVDETKTTTPSLPKEISQKATKRSEEIESSRNKVISKAKESKETINIVFIGHVDAGKSTIGGHILFLTGMIDKRTLEKYEKEAREKNRESWYFSYALDTNSDERDKGKTVEVGKAYFETKHKRFVLLDAPGHKAFVPNMISGAAQADIAVLVISARKGEFETGFDRGGQTREHAQIARISSVKLLIVVVNKMDDPTVNWSEERYNDITDRLSKYLKKSSWKSNEIYFMPISGFSGSNIKDPVSPDICPWWQGKPSFLGYLDSLPPINSDVEASAMVIISDRYKDKDMGLLLMGKVISGCFGKNDQFTLMPICKNFRIFSILSLEDEELEMAKVGENIKLRLSGDEEVDVIPGYVLCCQNNICPIGKTFDGHFAITDCKSIIAPGYKAVIHIHNAIDEVTLVSIKKVMDVKTHEWLPKAQPFLKQNDICIARFVLNNAQCIAPHTQIPYLSRFSIRDEGNASNKPGKTVGFGKILKVIQLE